MRGARPLPALAAAVVAALLFAGCGSVKPLSSSTRERIARADTVYVLPSTARYSTKGVALTRLDSVRTERLRKRLDSLLLPELARLLPGTVVLAADSAEIEVPGARNAHVRLHAKAFRRTVPRQALSDVSDVLLLIPTFGRNMASPLLPASKLRLEVRPPASKRVQNARHEDEVDADDPAELIFQVRKVLDGRYRG